MPKFKKNVTVEQLIEKEQSLSQKAYDRILKMLISRELPANTALNERQLAELLTISRTPVRDALNRLENEGLIIRNAGRTPIVKELSITELIETLHIRRTLESEAARLAAGRIPLAELDELERKIQNLLALAVPDPELDRLVDNQLHNTIAHYSGNQLLKQYIVSLRLKTRMFDIRQVPERFLKGHQEHLSLLAALREGDAKAAKERIAQHIDNVKSSIILKLSQF